MSNKPQTSPTLPWKTRISVFFVSAFIDVVRRPLGRINRGLHNFLDMKVPPNGNAVNGVKTADITVNPIKNLWFRLFTPIEPAANLPVIVYFHGGGFTLCSPSSKAYDFMCNRMAHKIPAIVVSVNYRLAPENRFPSAYEDGFDTLKFLDEKNFGGFPTNADLSRCFLAGDSAGANLAHHVACRAAGVEFREARVMGLISIQPFFGGEERTESEIRLAKGMLLTLEKTDWMWKAFLPEGANRDHEAANIMGPNATNISGVLKYPATQVIVGGYDLLQDRQRAYYQWLETSGKETYLIEYPNAFHGFYMFPELPEFSLLITEMGDFIKKQSSG